MNFEELYKKYKNGEANDEERKVVEEEIAKARVVNAELRDSEPVRSYARGATVRTVCIVLAVVAAASAVTAGAVFGVSTGSAKKKDNYSEAEAIESAKTKLSEHLGVEIGDKCTVKKAERELEMEHGISSSVYVYDIELVVDGVEYEIEVSAESGYAHIEDIDGATHLIGK